MDERGKNQQEILKNIIKKYPQEIKQLKEIYENKGDIKPVITIERLKELCRDNEVLEKLLQQTVDSFYYYTETVCAYQRIFSQDITDEEVKEQLEHLETIRTRVHNALIDNVGILARALKKFGKDYSWIEKLGPKTNRVAYGNLALENTFLQLLQLEETNKKEENNE